MFKNSASMDHRKLHGELAHHAVFFVIHGRPGGIAPLVVHNEKCAAFRVVDAKLEMYPWITKQR